MRRFFSLLKEWRQAPETSLSRGKSQPSRLSPTAEAASNAKLLWEKKQLEDPRLEQFLPAPSALEARYRCLGDGYLRARRDARP